MLAFTRRPNESFFVGKDITIKVLGHDKHGNVELGIEMDDSVSIHIEKTDLPEGSDKEHLQI